MIQQLQFNYSEKSKDIESGMDKNIQTHGELLNIQNNLYEIKDFQAVNQLAFLSKQREVIKKQIHNWGENVRSLYQLGDIHLLKKDYSKAKDIYSRIIRLDDKFLPAYEKLILTYTLLGEIESANIQHQKILTISNRRTDLLHNYILFRIIFFKNDGKKIDECIRDSKEIINKETKNYSVINTYGLILLNFKKQIKEAKKYFEKALSINPRYIHSINNLGVCHLRKNENEHALKYFQKAMEIDKYYPSAYENMASLFIEEGKLKDALSILDKGYTNRIILSNIWWHNYLWLKLENGHYQFAINSYLKLLESTPNNNFIYNNLGVCYLKLGNRKEALRYFDQAIDVYNKYYINKPAQDTRSLFPFYNVGRMAIDDGHISVVEKMSNRILTLKGNDGFGIYLKGRAYLMKNEYIVAEHYFEQALKDEPQIADIYPDLSFIYVSITHKYDTAIKLLNKAIKLDIKNIQILNNLAYAYIKHNEVDEAKKILDQFKTNEPAVISATRGLLFFSKGMLKQGIESYKKAYIKFNNHQENQKLLLQNSLYEQAVYWSKIKEPKEAIKLLKKARLIGRSYMSTDIDNLMNKLSK